MEYSIKEVVELLGYSEDWNADNDIICMDLMDRFPGYIFQWDNEQSKFIGNLVEN